MDTVFDSKLFRRLHEILRGWRAALADGQARRADLLAERNRRAGELKGLEAKNAGHERAAPEHRPVPEERLAALRREVEDLDERLGLIGGGEGEGLSARATALGHLLSRAEALMRELGIAPEVALRTPPLVVPGDTRPLPWREPEARELPALAPGAALEALAGLRSRIGGLQAERAAVERAPCDAPEAERRVREHVVRMGDLMPDLGAAFIGAAPPTAGRLLPEHVGGLEYAVRGSTPALVETVLSAIAPAAMAALYGRQAAAALEATGGAGLAAADRAARLAALDVELGAAEEAEEGLIRVCEKAGVVMDRRGDASLHAVFRLGPPPPSAAAPTPAPPTAKRAGGPPRRQSGDQAGC